MIYIGVKRPLHVIIGNKVIYMQLIAVAIGGFFGAILRFIISSQWNSTLGTFLVNIVGSFCLAWLFTYFASNKNLSKTLVTGIGTGFLGAFTTFSTFSVESLQLLSSSIIVGGLYIISTVFIGLQFSYLGYTVAKTRKEEN